MNIDDFKKKFNFACINAVKVAKKYLLDEVPSDFLLFLENRDGDIEGIHNLDIVVKKLFRDGSVPIWVDINIKNINDGKAILRCIYSEEFSDDESRFLHKWEKNPPFHVTGPYLPPAIAVKDFGNKKDQQRIEKFSITEVPDRE